MAEEEGFEPPESIQCSYTLNLSGCSPHKIKGVYLGVDRKNRMDLMQVVGVW